MPKKKIALVDVDGCLIQEGALNPELVEKLKNYDEIILFTQRGKLIQQRSLANSLAEDGTANTSKATLSEKIHTTTEAVNALNKVLNKRVHVSTSMDPYYDPNAEKGIGSYYQNELRQFEPELKDYYLGSARDGIPLPAGLTQDIETESNMVIKAKGYSEIISNQRELTREQNENKAILAREVDKVYPQGKVEQYQHLLKQLKNEGQDLNHIEIDYYDDSARNLTEIRDSQEVSKKPNCFVVQTKKIMDIQNKNLASIESRLSLADELEKYIKNRKIQQKEEGRNHHTTFSFFKTGTSATVKISAAEKLMKIIENEDNRKNISLNYKETKALKEGRLGNLVKEYCRKTGIKEITLSNTNNAPTMRK